MTQRSQFSASVVALAIAFTMQASSAAATDVAPDFRIMSDQEANSYRMAMQALSGQAREDYRNTQYEKLRQRALEQGYRMPVTPPWAGQGVAPTATTSAAAPTDTTMADDAAARHAAMRDKLATARESLQQAAAADNARLQAEAAAPQPAPTTPQTPAGPGPSATPTATATAILTPQPAAAGAGPDVPSPSAAPPAPSQSAAAPVFAPVTTPPEPPQAPAVAAGEQMPPPPPVAPPATPVPSPLAEPALPPPSVLAADSPVTTEAPTAGPQAPEMPVPPTAATGAAVPPPPPGMSTVDAYRESMRSRFDEYVKERQAKRDEAMRLQREQREAALEQSRAQINRNRFQPPFPYPSGPTYGPRYPGAFPGYRTPYWQQPRPPQSPQPQQEQ